MPEIAIRERLFARLFVFFSALFAFALSTSFFFISIASFGLLFTWLFSPGFKERLWVLFQSPWALFFVLLLLLHLAYLPKGDDRSFALSDLRIKIPLLLVPVVFSSSPRLIRNEFHLVLYAFLAGAIIACITGFVLYAGWMETAFIDTRQMGFFVSHVRLAILLSMGFVVSLWLFFTRAHKRERFFSLLCAMIIFCYLVLMQSPTAWLMLLWAGGIALFTKISHGKKKLLLAGMCMLALGGILGFDALMKHYEKKYFSASPNTTLPKQFLTAGGHLYDHELIEDFAENGYMVGWYRCSTEYEKVWSMRSKIPINGLDAKGQHIRFTMLRYVSSKGLAKDSAGIYALSIEDIQNIEEGITNASFTQYDGLRYRLYQLAYEWMNFRKGGNPSGHSVVMRIFFWECAFHIIKENPLSGTGMGNINRAYADTYSRIQSPLALPYRLRAHNQWITFCVCFGLPLGILISGMMFFPFWGRHKLPVLFVICWGMCLLSFFSEDTLESSVGASMSAFAAMFFYYRIPGQNVG